MPVLVTITLILFLGVILSVYTYLKRDPKNKPFHYFAVFFIILSLFITLLFPTNNTLNEINARICTQMKCGVPPF